MEAGDDPYEILGVSEDADEATIRKAYRKLALKWHPDKQKPGEDKTNATNRFAKIAGAYEILSDPVLKKDYDEQQEEEDGCGFDGDATYDYDVSDYENDDDGGGSDDDESESASPSANITTLAKATERTGKTWFGRDKKKEKKKEKPKPKGAATRKKKKKGKKPVHFSDPYEVFKRAFEEEWGVAYPGAKFDHIEGRDHHRAKGAPLALENGGRGDHKPSKSKKKKKETSPRKAKHKTKDDSSSDSSSSSSESSKEEKKGGILSVFRGGGKKKKDETALVVKKDDRQLAKKKKKQKEKEESTVAAPRGGTPFGNNRPTSMEERTFKVEHPDGRIETITEITIQRPDGSTEKMRRTDMPDSNSGNWNKPINTPKNKLLTDGGGKKEPDPKLLTSGGDKKHKKSEKSPKRNDHSPKRITDGREKSPKRDNNSKGNNRKQLGGGNNRKKLGGGDKLALRN